MVGFVVAIAALWIAVLALHRNAVLANTVAMHGMVLTTIQNRLDPPASADVGPPRKCPSGKCGIGPVHGPITAHKRDLVARCEQRGYSLDEVMPCVVEQDGDMWTVDTDHPLYPRYPKKEVQ